MVFCTFTDYEDAVIWVPTESRILRLFHFYSKIDFFILHRIEQYFTEDQSRSHLFLQEKTLPQTKQSFSSSGTLRERLFFRFFMLRPYFIPWALYLLRTPYLDGF